MHLGGDTLSKEPVTPQSGIYWFKHPLVFCLNLLLLLLLPRGDFSNFTLSYLLVGFFIQERAFFFFPSSTFIILFIYSHCVCVCVYTNSYCLQCVTVLYHYLFWCSKYPRLASESSSGRLCVILTIPHHSLGVSCFMANKIF